jgi:hypothetical protein
MTASRPARIWALIAAQAASRGGPVSASDACVAVVDAVGLTGAWLSVGNGVQTRHMMMVTDTVSEHFAELELTLGEGPSLDVVTSDGPVLCSDLGATEAVSRWPVLAEAARRTGAAAVFAFPLRVGAIQAGVMGLYRDHPGPLSDFQLGDALIFADAATLLLLGSAAETAAGQPAELGLHRAEIDQATGMVAEQLGVGIAEAFVRLRAHAYARDRRLSDLAQAIVARRVRLGPDND